jgi:hypothetical protein
MISAMEVYSTAPSTVISFLAFSMAKWSIFHDFSSFGLSLTPDTRSLRIAYFMRFYGQYSHFDPENGLFGVDFGQI